MVGPESARWSLESTKQPRFCKLDVLASLDPEGLGGAALVETGGAEADDESAAALGEAEGTSVVGAAPDGAAGAPLPEGLGASVGLAEGVVNGACPLHVGFLGAGPGAGTTGLHPGS